MNGINNKNINTNIRSTSRAENIDAKISETGKISAKKNDPLNNRPSKKYFSRIEESPSYSLSPFRQKNIFSKIGIDLINSNKVMMNFNKRNYFGKMRISPKVNNVIKVVNMQEDNLSGSQSMRVIRDSANINTTTILNGRHSQVVDFQRDLSNNLSASGEFNDSLILNKSINKSDYIKSNITINNGRSRVTKDLVKENLKINFLKKINEENSEMDNCVDFLKFITEGDSTFINHLKLFEASLDLELAMEGLSTGAKIYSNVLVKKQSTIFCLRKFFMILKNGYSNKINKQSYTSYISVSGKQISIEFFKFDIINKIYAKSLKLQIIFYAIVLITNSHILIDSVIKTQIRKLMTALMSSVVNIFDSFICGEVSLNYAELLRNLRNDFEEKFNKICKNYKFPKNAKTSDNINRINKNLDSVVMMIKQFSNSTFKFSQMKFFHNVIFELLNEIDKRSFSDVAEIILNCVTYSIIETSNRRSIREVSQLFPGVFLPQIDSKFQYTLVLDLDETLVHYFYTQVSGGIFFVRPYTFEFLSELSNLFEIVIFTAGTKDYADEILDKLDPQANLIRHRLYRNHTSTLGLYIIKDLSKLGRDISKVIIVDNIQENFKSQPNNGLVIKTWNDDINDTQLRDIGRILKDIHLMGVSDVRSVIRRIKEEHSSTNTYENVNVAFFV